MDTPLFRMLKKALPGPYTFILPASRQVPKLIKTKRDAVGIRVPDNLRLNAEPTSSSKVQCCSFHRHSATLERQSSDEGDNERDEAAEFLLNILGKALQSCA